MSTSKTKPAQDPIDFDQIDDVESLKATAALLLVVTLFVGALIKISRRAGKPSKKVANES